MIANPLDRFKHHKTELPFRASGWGPPRSWPVPTDDGESLVFKIRLPDEIELVDVSSLAASARGAPPIVAEGAEALERAAGPAGVIVIGALRPSDVREGEREVLATLTVAFSDKVKGPPSAEDFRIADSAHTTKSHEEVVKVSDKATLIIRVSTESLGEGTDPVLMLLWQYLIETSYGALVMAFSTTNQRMMGPASRKLYDSIVETGFIGQEPPAS